MGGPSGPRLLAQIAASGAKSFGPEGPPTGASPVPRSRFALLQRLRNTIRSGNRSAFTGIACSSKPTNISAFDQRKLPPTRSSPAATSAITSLRAL
ncbi:DUF6053 domain-containing protein [Lysobacter enzymogenes]|uniref:DUF6053 domain-containing protein n=1 Tax=Lysobacter enzymogenes TaxID=69 RepID=UPI003D18CB14